MNKPVAYLETSFVSYLTGRVSADEKIARDQSATVRWWKLEAPKWHCVASQAMADEARDGDADAVARRMEFLEGMDLLKTTEEAERLVETLLVSHVLPEKARRDALHIALATVHGAELLLTWKCGTIANALKLPQIYLSLEKAGYKCPVISTPRELLAAMDPPDKIMQEVYRARERLWQLGGGTMRGVCEYLRECGRRAKARGVLWIESEEEREAIGAEVRARLAAEAAGETMCVGEEAGKYVAREAGEEAHAEARRGGGGAQKGKKGREGGAA